jgi:hypothetical protein
MAYPFQEICAQRHTCQHRKHDWETYTTDYDSECVGGCKCGDNWNEFFETKPTPQDAEDWAKAFYIKGIQAKQIAEDRRRNLFSEAQEAGQIITINFDKDRTADTLKDMEQCLADIRLANYKWLDKDAIACYEFYSEKSPNTPNNPHIHIATKRMCSKTGKPIKATSIAQILRRKFANLECVYGVNGQERTWKIARDYVDGSSASKSGYDAAEGSGEGEKWKYTKQDIAFRADNNLEHPVKMGCSVNEIIG